MAEIRYTYIYDIPYSKRRELNLLLDADRGWEALAAEFDVSADDVAMLGVIAFRPGSSAADSLLRNLGNENTTITELYDALVRIRKIRAANLIKDLVRPVTPSFREQPSSLPCQNVFHNQQKSMNGELNLPSKPIRSSSESSSYAKDGSLQYHPQHSYPADSFQQMSFQPAASNLPTLPAKDNKNPETVIYNRTTLDPPSSNKSNQISGMNQEKFASFPQEVSGNQGQHSFTVNEMTSHPMSLKANPDGHEMKAGTGANRDASMCSMMQCSGTSMGNRLEGATGEFHSTDHNMPSRIENESINSAQRYKNHNTYYNIPAEQPLKTPDGKSMPSYSFMPNSAVPSMTQPSHKFGVISHPHEPVESHDYSTVPSSQPHRLPDSKLPDRPESADNLCSQMHNISVTNNSSMREPLTTDQQRQGVALMHTPSFSFTEIQKATQNFQLENVIGSGAYGTVYRGIMKQTVFAIKKLRQNDDFSKERSRQQHHISEIEALQMYRHENIVQLCGYSMDGPELCLVYTYMVNGSLEDRLACKGNSQPLNWCKRVNIMVGAARGIQYLHSSTQPLIHGDIKSSNILLDKHFEAKIADFGLAKQATSGEKAGKYTHVTLMESGHQIQGSRPYLPTDFFRNFKLHTKTDTFSFGVVIMEVCTGLRAFDEKRQGEKFLYEYVRNVVSSENDEKILSLGDSHCPHWPHAIYLSMIQLAYQCTNDLKKNRPEMGKVCKELEKTDVKMQLYLNTARNVGEAVGSMADVRHVNMHMSGMLPAPSMQSFYMSHHSHGGPGASLHEGVPVSMLTPLPHTDSKTKQSEPTLVQKKIVDEALVKEHLGEVPEITLTPATGDFSSGNYTDVKAEVKGQAKEIPSYEDPRYLQYDETKLKDTDVVGADDNDDTQHASDPVKLAILEAESRKDNGKNEHVTPMQLQQYYDEKMTERSEDKENVKSDVQVEDRNGMSEMVQPCANIEGQSERLCVSSDEDLYSSAKHFDVSLKSEREAISEKFQEKKLFAWMEQFYEDCEKHD